MKEIKHIIFDMDGVIIDTEPEYKRRLKYFLEVKGYEVSDDLCNKTCGSSLKDAYRILKNEINNFDMSFEQYVSEKRNILKNDIIDIRKVVDPEIYPLLEWLKVNGFSIALASSTLKERIMDNLSILNLKEYFDVIVSGMDFKRSKPDPKIYYYTMNQLRITPDKCLVVEDSTYGIKAAKMAGAIVIAKIDNRFGYDQSKADYKIEKLGEIIKLWN